MFRKIRQILKAIWVIAMARDVGHIVIIVADRDQIRYIKQIQNTCRFSDIRDVYRWSMPLLQWASNKISMGKYIMASREESDIADAVYFEYFKDIPGSPYRQNPKFLTDDNVDWENYLNERLEKKNEP